MAEKEKQIKCTPVNTQRLVHSGFTVYVTARETSDSPTIFLPPCGSSLASCEIRSITFFLLTSIWTRFKVIGCHTARGCLLQGWPTRMRQWIRPDSNSSSQETKYTLAPASHSQLFVWSVLTRSVLTRGVWRAVCSGFTSSGHLGSSVVNGWRQSCWWFATSQWMNPARVLQMCDHNSGKKTDHTIRKYCMRFLEGFYVVKIGSSEVTWVRDDWNEELEFSF